MTSAHALPFGGLGGRRRFDPPPEWRALRAMTGHGPGRHRHGPPFGGFGGPPFGGFGGPPFGGHGRRRRMRRGDVRSALLLLLDEQPRNGYGLMQEIEQRSSGVWRPSPGSVYPALSQLEDEGLVRAEPDEGGRKRYALTDEGRAYVADNRERLGEPWAQAGQEVGKERLELRGLLWQLGAAAMQVASAGTDTQVGQARQVLVDARRALYRLLAEDEPETDADDGAPPPVV
jgi:DNA-binding PadR family transcriptional regulator